MSKNRMSHDICEGCLSCDRTPTIIVNGDIKEVYYTIIGETNNRTLMLCWECVANIKRYIMFKKRCLRAHYLLNNNTVVPGKFNSLSSLCIVKNNIKINIYFKDEECYSENLRDLQNQSLSYRTERSSDICLGFKATDGIYPHKQESVTHLVSFGDVGVNVTPDDRKLDYKNETNIPFIKIEDDVYHVEGCLMDRLSDVDDAGFKELYTSTNKSCDKTEEILKINKNNAVEEDFNDSDEEPLKNKSSKAVDKKIDKKKIQDGVYGTKSGRRREKPAGVVNNHRVRKKLQQLNVEEGQLEMVVLSWEEVEEERQKALRSVVFTRHQYQCGDCIVGFNHKFKLDNHMKKHDPNSGDFSCEVCRVRCKDSHALSAHRRRHRVRWRCCLCGGRWSRACVAADHAARHHRAARPTHTCTVCGDTAPTLGKLRNHIKSHGERQECELCGKSFRDRTSLRTHLFIHRGEKEYSCSKCDKKFLFKKAMEVHLVTHDAPANLYCYQCDMTFKNRMSFTQHMKYSLKHIDPEKLKYACQICDKKFAKAARLEEHKLAVHLKVTPVQCSAPGCVFACSSRPVLRTHVRMVHRNARALRNHVCDTCGKTYTTKKTLEGHMRSHTGERPFKCALCPSTFGYEAALYNHNKLVHLKVKTNKRSTHHPMPLPGPQSDLA